MEPSCCRRLAILVLVAGAGPFVGFVFAEQGTCPPSFDCSPRMQRLLAKGMEQSQSFRILVQTVGYLSSVELRLRFRPQPAGKHARSFLQVRGAYTSEQGFRVRQVASVKGEISIRYLAYAHDQISDLAHELTHVLHLLQGVPPESLDDPQCRVEAFRDTVRAELEAYSDVDGPR